MNRNVRQMGKSIDFQKQKVIEISFIISALRENEIVVATIFLTTL